MHVVDWLPTLLTAVKGKLRPGDKDVVERFLLKGIDGIDQWNTLISDEPSKRTEFLYNVDPLFDDDQRKSKGNAGIR